MSKVQVKRSKIHGRGVFAKQDLVRGEEIGTFIGRPARRNSPYVLWTETCGKPIGILGTGELRFVNHSDRPNAKFDGLILLARKKIRAGDEITINYDGE